MEAEFVELCSDGDLEGVWDALLSGVDVNSKGRFGYTGLMWALLNSHTAVASFLLEQEGLDIDIVSDCHDMTALWLAAVNDQNSECLALILAKSSSVNQAAESGRTALWAVDHNAVRCVQVLLSDERTDPNIKDDAGDTPLMIAVKWNDVACVELLLADPRVDLMTRDNYQRSEEEVAR